MLFESRAFFGIWYWIKNHYITINLQMRKSFNKINYIWDLTSVRFINLGLPLSPFHHDPLSPHGGLGFPL